MKAFEEKALIMTLAELHIIGDDSGIGCVGVASDLDAMDATLRYFLRALLLK